MYIVVREAIHAPKEYCMRKTSCPFRIRAAHCRTHGRGSRVFNLRIRQPEHKMNRRCARCAGSETRAGGMPYAGIGRGRRAASFICRQYHLSVRTWKSTHALATCTDGSRSSMGTGDVHGYAGSETCAEGILYAEGKPSIPSPCSPSTRTRKSALDSATCAYGRRNAMGSGYVHGYAGSATHAEGILYAEIEAYNSSPRHGRVHMLRQPVHMPAETQ